MSSLGGQTGVTMSPWRRVQPWRLGWTTGVESWICAATSWLGDFWVPYLWNKWGQRTRFLSLLITGPAGKAVGPVFCNHGRRECFPLHCGLQAMPCRPFCAPVSATWILCDCTNKTDSSHELGLELKCPLKTVCWRCGHLPAAVLEQGRGTNYEEARPPGRKLGYWGSVLCSDIGKQVLSVLSPFALATMKWAVLFQYMTLAMTFLPYHRPNTREPMTMDWNLWNPRQKETFPPLNWFS